MAKHSIASQASRLTKDLSLASGSSLASEAGASSIPRLVYGTAWKKERSQDLVYKALKNGFRGVDTAAQPKHYHEPGVAAGVQQALDEGIVKRQDLFYQTKFTPPSGQSDVMPYSLDMSLKDQVKTSLQASIGKFKVNGHDDYLDSIVLHSPLREFEDTLTVWKTFEEFHPKKIRNLGISNTDLPTLKALYDNVRVKPAVVQNRFHDRTGYEVELREFCKSHGIVFQSFWTLSANPALARSAPVREVSQNADVPVIAAYYSLVLGLGDITILDGTTQEPHMRDDLDGIEQVGRWAEGEGASIWQSALAAFKQLVGDE